MISLLFGFHDMNYKTRLAESVAHITVTIGPYSFRYNSDLYTHIFDICNVDFFFLELVSKAHAVVVKIGVKLKIFSIIKNLCRPSLLLGYIS